MSDLVSGSRNELVDPQGNRLVEFLKSVGLPYDNVLAAPSERAIISSNLPAYLNTLPAEVKSDALYLSKFVIGAVSGLFDYALNAIWNEVVLDLRKKATLYGLDIFFDAAVGSSKAREFYKSEEELPALKDSVMLDTCRKLELISDITYKKLKHILDLRNDIGISHPTNYSINSYELMGWLQTCVQDVLNDRPTAAALQVQAFVVNLKSRLDPLDAVTKQIVERSFLELPTHLCGNLLRTIFGIYVAPDTDPAVRKNISVIAPSLWNGCGDQPRYRLGIVLEGYNTNLHQEKHNLGQQFFQTVGGNAYRSPSERVIIVDNIINDLLEKHSGRDNFANEGPVAASLYSYVPDQSSIFDNLAERLFRAVLMCRVGREVAYCNGISQSGKLYYEKILALAGDKYTPHILASLGHYDVASKLTGSSCRTKAKEALEIVRKNVINERLAECITFLIGRIEADPRCYTSVEFKRLAAGYLR